MSHKHLTLHTIFVRGRIETFWSALTPGNGPKRSL